MLDSILRFVDTQNLSQAKKILTGVLVVSGMCASAVAQQPNYTGAFRADRSILEHETPSAPANLLMPHSPTEQSFTHVDTDASVGSQSISRSSQALDSQPPLPPQPVNNLRGGTGNVAQPTPPARQHSVMEDATQLPAAGFNALPVDRSTTDTNQIQRTTFTQQLNPSQTGAKLANQLMDRYSIDHAPNPLPGNPIKLLEMLQQPIPVQQRQTMINQYWETYYDWATLRNRSEYAQWLGTIQNSQNQVENGILNTAQSIAANLAIAAEIQLVKSQAKLADYIPRRQTNLLPLPADKPLVQKYKTNYQLYQSHGMIPARMRGIDVILPKTLVLIGKRADTAQLARTTANRARQSMSSRQATVSMVLEAGRNWRQAEQDLIASVVTYNQAIADYSMTMTRNQMSAEQIVRMLIAKPKSSSVLASSLNGGVGNQPLSQYAQPGLGRANAGHRPDSSVRAADNRPVLGGAQNRVGNLNQFGNTTFSSPSNSNSRFGNPSANPQSKTGTQFQNWGTNQQFNSGFGQ